MKMDAMQKRKVRRVAMLHLGLTALIVLIAMLQPAMAFSGNLEKWRRFQEHLIWRQAWDQFWTDIAFLLQPQFWLSAKLFRAGVGSVFLTWVIIIFQFVAVPLWSFCFAWLFVKLDNWLNHFPVLGKKVF
jgi:hypothetical protein